MSKPEFPPLQERIEEFLRKQFQSGYDHCRISEVEGDASTRHYFRYLSPSNESLILAVYPDPFQEERFAYKQVYDLFQVLELPLPRTLAMDGDLGIVLQQDLGDESMLGRLPSAGAGERKRLFRRAIDYLVTIQCKGTSALRPEHEASQLALDEGKLGWELAFFQRHYLDSYRKRAPEDEALLENLQEEFSRIAAELARYPRLLCHRDYQVRNLMRSGGELYIIDFQDARMGPASYDLVSLLKDSVQLDSEEINELINYYLGRTGHPGQRGPFERQFHLMSIQRLLKALGTYGYQIDARGKRSYQQYIPGSLRRALVALQAVPEFPYIQSILQKELEA